MTSTLSSHHPQPHHALRTLSSTSAIPEWPLLEQAAARPGERRQRPKARTSDIPRNTSARERAATLEPSDRCGRRAINRGASGAQMDRWLPNPSVRFGVHDRLSAP